MHKLALFAPLLLAACTTPSAEAPAEGEASGHKCVSEGADRFVGQVGNSESGAAIMNATHSGTLRWAWPNSMLTMDFREDRVTVTLDSGGKVAKINCG